MLRCMEIREGQYQRSASSLPRQPGSIRVTNLQFLNALLYVAALGCKWRGLPKRIVPWHTIYTQPATGSTFWQRFRWHWRRLST